MNTTRIIGLLYLIAILSYATGSSMASGQLDSYNHWHNQIPPKATFATGALLMLLNSFSVIGIGVLTRPLLRRTHPILADFYVVFRVLEAIILCVGIISLLGMIDIRQLLSSSGAESGQIYQSVGTILKRSNYYAYQVAMIVLGVIGTAFCYALFQNRWIPRWMSILGMVGYASLLTGAVLELLGWTVGFPFGMLFPLPGGIFEVIFGIYLIAGRLKITN